MSVSGLHLTSIGHGALLLEPSLSLDIGNGGAALEEIVRSLQRINATRLYYDLAELAIIEPLYYNWLNALGRACRTINVRMICVHMQPTAAFALSRYMEQMPTFETALDVEIWNKESK
jgi:rsbT antagonist protein RsbS